MVFKLELSPLNQAITESFQEAGEAYRQAQVEEIRAEKWFWPRATQRRNGVLVPPGNRDIIDLKKLLDSLIVSQQGLTITYTYGNKEVTHAAVTHEGSRNKKILPRPWTETARERVQIGQVMAEGMERKL